MPSEVSYAESPNGYKQWGFDIEQGKKIVWTKLQLDQQTRLQELQWVLEVLDGINIKNKALSNIADGVAPDYPADEPVDVAAHYLHFIREWLVKALLKQYKKPIMDEYDIELVVTIPAVSL